MREIGRATSSLVIVRIYVYFDCSNNDTVLCLLLVSLDSITKHYNTTSTEAKVMPIRR